MATTTNPKNSVLFVDDCHYVLEAIRRIVSFVLPHWRAEFVSCGDAALQRLEQCRFDVLVTDMPGVTGAQLVHRAKAAWPHMACLLFTGDNSVRALVPEATGVIPKPCSLDLLRRTLDAAVGKHTAEPQGAMP